MNVLNTIEQLKGIKKALSYYNLMLYIFTLELTRIYRTTLKNEITFQYKKNQIFSQANHQH